MSPVTGTVAMPPPGLALEDFSHRHDNNDESPVHMCSILVSIDAFVNIVSFESQKNIQSQPKETTLFFHRS